MTRLLTVLVALVLLLSPIPASAQSRLYTSAQVIAWSAAQLDGYYRTMFALMGQEYETPKLTIVPEGETVHTGCGAGKSPKLAFYCPADRQIVFSEEFADELYEEDDFLPAYVIAHEWAHHAQRISGTLPRPFPDDGEWNEVYVIENELRADCMAGTWMRNVAERGFLGGTDMPRVLLKASQIGDLGLMGRGNSHGTGAERLAAVFIGYEEGLMGCMAITPLERNKRPLLSPVLPNPPPSSDPPPIIVTPKR